jgi:hypothetical protein
VQQAREVVKHFSGMMRPALLYVGLIPDFSYVLVGMEPYGVPVTDEEEHKLIAALDEEMWWTEETGDVPYAGIPTFRVLYDLLATVRDKQGAYQEVWFPKSGEVIFRAHYLDESEPIPVH